MSVNIDLKKEFLNNFQNKIITVRKLLFAGNHKWSEKLLDNLSYDIKKNDWLDLQKKHQLIMIITNSWWIYLNSLRKYKEGKVDIDLIRYIDAYKRFLSFLSKLDDFYLFNNFSTNLLKQFLKMEDLSQNGITKFINSFCAKVIERNDYQRLLELQILLIFLRKSIVPSEYFQLSMEILGKTVFKLEPSKRSMFIYILFENVCLEYKLMENSSEFVKTISRILLIRLPGNLKNELSSMNRISINERSFNPYLVDLEELISYLNNIGEYAWIIVFIRNIFLKIQEYKSFGEAVTYIRKYIDFSVRRNRFDIAFGIYDFLEDLFIYQTDLSYDNILIELWVEACKKFVDMKEKKYLLQSLEKLNNHLKLPQTSSEIYHYFYTSNILWQFKSMFFSLEQRDFWKMMFFRALFEEKNFIIAQKIIPYLEEDFNRVLTDVESLYSEVETLQNQIYSFKDYDNTPKSFHEDFAIKQMMIRINSKGQISYKMISIDKEIVEGTISNEFWNDTQILEIYNELFYESEERKYSFSLKEFGELLYLFLPKLIRDFFKSFKTENLNFIPQIYFILDSMTIPFDLIYDNNFFLLKYSSGYKIGEIPLGGIPFEEKTSPISKSESSNDNYNVLIIDAINSTDPMKWNENKKQKELIFPFPAGSDELNFIINFLSGRADINQINALNGINSTRDNILLNLSKEVFNIIIFVGNIFYSRWSPKNSFFLTNDNQIITCSEISRIISQNDSKIQPFLFFNTQIYDTEGNKQKNVLKTFGEIVYQFDFRKITGILTRNFPLFNPSTKEICAIFFNNLLNKINQGASLLKARQQCIANKIEKIVGQSRPDSTSLKGTKKIDLRSSLAISSFLLFGKPWRKI
ncbi:hypothetical protein LCGC14_0830620 [marine sediment metagenome]|uniref:CHAT domain-containing protein n=1 Tax=marine sediment metagenome TaxID=412755 RepID=A0A0F9Q1D3_9ZZZZ